MTQTSLFALARKRGWAWQEIADMTSPASPLGPPPGVRDAIRTAIGKTIHYPEPSPRLLVESMAKAWDIGMNQILLGRGATEIVYFLASVWRKDPITVAVPAHPETLHANPYSRQVRTDSLHDWSESGIFILERPNTLTGQVMDFDRLRVWLRTGKNPVIVDERAIESTGEPTAISLLPERANLFVLRSLSSLHALPGLRIGALVGDPESIAKLAEKREPYLIDVVAEAAAVAAFDDPAHLERARSVIAEERDWLWRELKKLPAVTPVLGASNSFLLYLSSNAGDLCRWLLDRKVLVDNCTGVPGIDGDAVRFYVGSRPMNERLVDMLKEYICG
jgi:threonine-phosphate decarboxylase